MIIDNTRDKRIFKVVLAMFERPVANYPNKMVTLVEAMISGTIAREDLAEINEPNAKLTIFPANFHEDTLPEGKYSSLEVIENFVKTIGPFLSDRSLYHIVHQLTAIEMTRDQRYRNSTLAKSFMQYEFVRHMSSDTVPGYLPLPILSHISDFGLDKMENIISLCILHAGLNPGNPLAQHYLGQNRVGLHEQVRWFKEVGAGEFAEGQHLSATPHHTTCFNDRLLQLKEQYRALEEQHKKQYGGKRGRFLGLFFSKKKAAITTTISMDAVDASTSFENSNRQKRSSASVYWWNICLFFGSFFKKPSSQKATNTPPDMAHANERKSAK
jgi:hypothetical protein